MRRSHGPRRCESGLACPQLLLGPLALGQVQHEGDTLVPGFFEGRRSNQDGHATAIFAEVFLLVWRDGSGRCQFSQGALRSGAPFRRRQLGPVQAITGEILALVSHHFKERIIRFGDAHFVRFIDLPFDLELETPMMLESTRRRTFASLSRRACSARMRSAGSSAKSPMLWRMAASGRTRSRAWAVSLLAKAKNRFKRSSAADAPDAPKPPAERTNRPPGPCLRSLSPPSTHRSRDDRRIIPVRKKPRAASLRGRGFLLAAFMAG